MPKLTNPSEHNTCFYCGRQAQYISVNTKRLRCNERVTKCPAVIQKQQQQRNANWLPEQRRSYMKELSIKAHQTLSSLQHDEAWCKARSQNISRSKSYTDQSGCHNPMWGKQHTLETKTKMKKSASLRDNSNIGKYVRTPKHRDAISKRMTTLIKEGRLFKSSNTKIELEFVNVLNQLNIKFEQQFLLQEGWIGGQNPWFRHCYDFYLTEYNTLVEVDGNYWHSTPNQKVRDIQCEQYAISHGYHIFRISEHSFKERLTVVGFVKAILEYTVA